MHDLIALTPLGSTAPKVDDFGAIRIAECPQWALASLAARQGQTDAAQAGARTFLGADLPEAAQTTTLGQLSAFWTGPDQWMIEAPHETHEDLAAQVKAAVGDTASVTEQTDGWVRFDVTGPACHDVMERLCNVDTRSMQTGAATRTRLEHLGCFVICREAHKHFSVIGPRSSAGSIHHALVTAAKSVI